MDFGQCAVCHVIRGQCRGIIGYFLKETAFSGKMKELEKQQRNQKI